MSKIEALTPINASYGGIAKLNAHLQKIEDAFDNTLSRDGSSPNQMEADIDFNGNTGLNVADPAYAHAVANKRYVDNLLNTVVSLGTFLSNPSGVGVVHTSPDGAAIGSKVVYVDLFDGIYSDGSADSTAGLKALVDTYGKTNIEYVFNSAGTYKLHSTDAIYAATPAIVNGVCTNFYLNFNGATIEIDRTFDNGASSFLWQIRDGSRNVRIGRVRVIQDLERPFADMFLAGTWWMYIADSVDQVHFEEFYTRNCLIGIDLTRGSDASKRVRNVYVEGYTAVHTSYPLGLRNNGDDLHVRYLNCFECGRPAICYNWHGILRIDQLIEQDSVTQIKLMNSTTGSNLYSNDDETGAAIITHIGLAPTGQADFGRAYRMSIEQRGTDPGKLGPLYIRSHTTLDQSGATTQGFCTFIKSSTDSVVDTTPGRGHKISVIMDIEIHDAPGHEIAAFFPTSGGDWAGEDVNFVLNRLVVRGSASSSIEIDYDGMAQGPLLQYVDLVGTATETGTPSATAAKVIWKTSAGNNGNLVTEGRANIFTEDQNITKSAAALKLNNTNGTASTLRLSADNGLVYMGSETDTTVRWIQANSTRGGVSSVGPYSETGWMLRDGIAEPATNATYATIYIDTADGDLKIKFGDGTVKTIVVDT